ncbi:MAG: type II toxin-antitoxin system VapC family toxin [Gemmataceae bacterium]
MIFADLVAGDSVFLDANTFIYYFSPDLVLGPPCSQLLQRIENRELTGFTAVHLLAEVVHKLMTIEAVTLLGWPMTGMANRLRRHPAQVQQLSAYKVALDRICQSQIQVLDVTTATLRNAAAICQQTGRLINDAQVVALMRQQALTRLASHDSDFDRIPGLVRYAPV